MNELPVAPDVGRPAGASPLVSSRDASVSVASDSHVVAVADA
jgi:hypothetical protein